MKKSKLSSARLLIGGLIVVIVGGLAVWRFGWGGRSPRGFTSRMTVSAKQIKAVGKAIETYAAKRKERPERLEQLVDAGLLSASQLYDARRGKVAPTVDPETHHYVPHPDVLYFPALTTKDPPRLVLLCTLLLHADGDRYQVITNNGAYEDMDARELVVTLQKTYTHIGSLLREKNPARR